MKKPLLIVIAGPNGSGKTSLTSKILLHDWVETCEYINPDNIAKDIFGDWNDKNAVLNAAKLAQEKRELCIKEQRSLIFETVLSTKEKINFIIDAKNNGYFVRLFFVSTDSPEINASRITKRVMEGGHDVPISKIISRYYKSIANCSICTQIVDRLYLYDNSVEFAEPVLLCRMKDGVIAKQYSKINAWANSVLESAKEF